MISEAFWIAQIEKLKWNHWTCQYCGITELTLNTRSVYYSLRLCTDCYWKKMCEPLFGVPKKQENSDPGSTPGSPLRQKIRGYA